jgi:hypothetical protein
MIKVRRKSILYGITILATAAVAVINVHLNSQPQTSQSSVTLKKIEALSSEKDEDKGTPNCEQYNSGKKECNNKIIINGKEVIPKYYKYYYCKSGGKNTKCTTGSVYWDASGNELSNTVTEIACRM